MSFGITRIPISRVWMGLPLIAFLEPLASPHRQENVFSPRVGGTGAVRSARRPGLE